MSSFFIADTHFYHKRVIDYCERPFESLNEMHNTIIQKWNMTVSPNDTVYHLGDVTFGNFEKTRVILKKLKGNKILIRGNHDLSRSDTWFTSLGFSKVYNELILEDKYLLTHKPKRSLDYINVHGHTHNINTNFKNPEKYICVSVELTNYKPVKIYDFDL